LLHTGYAIGWNITAHYLLAHCLVAVHGRTEVVASSTKKQCQLLFKTTTTWSLQVTSWMWKQLLESLDVKNSSGTIPL